MKKDYPLDEILLPMGATTVKDADKMDEIWESKEYIAEPKWDGSRYISVGGRFFSRRLSVKDGFPVEKTENVPHLVKILGEYPQLILDGEIYIDGAKSNDVVSIMGANKDKALWRQGFGEFTPPDKVGGKGYWRLDETDEIVEVPKKETAELLANFKSSIPVNYVVFDILQDIDGNSLMHLPWHERRAILEEQMEIVYADHPTSESIIVISDYVTENKKEFNADIMRRGGEGVMLKNINGAYFPDKKPRWNWIKVKQEITSDVIITGFKDAKRDYEGDEQATWQYWEDIEGNLVHLNGEGAAADYRILTGKSVVPVSKFYYMGWIGSVLFSQYDPKGGVDDFGNYTDLKEVGYCSGIKESLRQDMTENKDKYIGECMEISAMERTKDGYFRHPQFLRMRPDKPQSGCVIGLD